jgi:hypothetical protein
MNMRNTSRETAVDWLTTIAIATIAISLTIAFHEGIHAVTCLITGSDLQEYSALHVSCIATGVWQEKFIAGSASIANIILGTVILVLLHRSTKWPEHQFFLWLFMLTNWLNGAGYWMFSGIANVGDWANVISGWQPHWLWRIFMTTAGAGLYMFFVWLALKELGKIIGGIDFREQISRATKLGILAYLTIFLVILTAGLFNPYGITGEPAMAALFAALGGLSPLLWMMQWFRANSFAKLPNDPLVVQRQWPWIGAAAITYFIYAFVLGRTLYF